MIAAVVLSAGESSRMGRPKALLPVDGTRFIERIVAELQRTTVGKILVVLGHNAAWLREQVAHLPVMFVVNEDYRQGQLSSLHAAIRQLTALPEDERIEAILVHLVDHPYIDAKLVDEMIQRFRQSGKLIVVPRHGTRRGHPVLFSAALFGELLDAPLDQGAKAVVNAHREDTLEVETDLPGISIDIDTPEEYRRHVKGD
jgi:molybdenum cofactor cytidylyltransferase